MPQDLDIKQLKANMADTRPEQDLLSGTAAVAASSVAAATAPSAEPPAAAEAGIAAGIGASVWVNNKKINALWSINGRTAIPGSASRGSAG